MASSNEFVVNEYAGITIFVLEIEKIYNVEWPPFSWPCLLKSFQILIWDRPHKSGKDRPGLQLKSQYTVYYSTVYVYVVLSDFWGRGPGFWSGIWGAAGSLCNAVKTSEYNVKPPS